MHGAAFFIATSITALCLAGTAGIASAQSTTGAGNASRPGPGATSGSALGQATDRNGAMTGDAFNHDNPQASQPRPDRAHNTQPPIDSGYGARTRAQAPGIPANRHRLDEQTPPNNRPRSRPRNDHDAINRYQGPSTNINNTRIDPPGE